MYLIFLLPTSSLSDSDEDPEIILRDGNPGKYVLKKDKYVLQGSSSDEEEKKEKKKKKKRRDKIDKKRVEDGKENGYGSDETLPPVSQLECISTDEDEFEGVESEEGDEDDSEEEENEMEAQSEDEDDEDDMMMEPLEVNYNDCNV